MQSIRGLSTRRDMAFPETNGHFDAGRHHPFHVDTASIIEVISHCVAVIRDVQLNAAHIGWLANRRSEQCPNWVYIISVADIEVRLDDDDSSCQAQHGT